LSGIGVGIDSVEAGPHVGMWSVTRDFTEAERQRLEAQLDRTYKDFTGKVAEARRLTPEQIDQVARGRVWTGEDAQARGLIDTLGGYRAALQVAREAAGLAPDQPIKVEEFPRRKSLWEVIDALMDADLEDRLQGPVSFGPAWIHWLFAQLRLGTPFAIQPLSLP
jgi:protease-4